MDQNNTFKQSMQSQAFDINQPWVMDLLRQEKLSFAFSNTLSQYYVPLAAQLAEKRQSQEPPLIVGINGSQGSGKSTLALFLKNLLERLYKLSTVVISIDDLYLNQEERQKLAAQVHPLFETRGVPGTHHAKNGLRLLQSLRAGEEALIPRFDKSTDNPFPIEAWAKVSCPAKIVLLEGWCVGARPQPEENLEDPINPLEASEDPEGIWRGYSNVQLQEDYALLFDELDLLVCLKAPDFDCVFNWRMEQEAKLAARTSPQASGIMDASELERFIMHYERLTRWMLADLPARADYTLSLNSDRSIAGSTFA